MDLLLNMLDFFQVSTQESVMKIVGYISSNINSQSDFDLVKNYWPALINLMERHGSKVFDHACQSLKRFAESPLRFYDAYNAMDKVTPLVEQVAENGLVSKCFEVLAISGIDKASQIAVLKTLATLCKYSPNIAIQSLQDYKVLEVVHKRIQQYSDEKVNIQDTLHLLNSVLPAIDRDS